MQTTSTTCLDGGKEQSCSACRCAQSMLSPGWRDFGRAWRRYPKHVNGSGGYITVTPSVVRLPVVSRTLLFSGSFCANRLAQTPLSPTDQPTSAVFEGPKKRMPLCTVSPSVPCCDHPPTFPQIFVDHSSKPPLQRSSQEACRRSKSSTSALHIRVGSWIPDLAHLVQPPPACISWRVGRRAPLCRRSGHGCD